MKKIALALGLVAATAMAAPLSAQSRNDGPWWDPANTGTRSGSTTRTDTRDGRVYDDGRIYDSRSADGRWRAEGRDRRGNVIYVRTRYDNNGNVIRERATRDRLGRYQVIDRRVVQQANRRNDDRRYDDRRSDDGRRNRGARDGGPAFCRSGAGHPVHGRRWCVDKGYDLGSYDDRRGRGKGKGKDKGNGRR